MQESQNSNANEVISNLAHELLKEKRTDRFWRNIRFALWFLLFAFITVSTFSLMRSNSAPINKTGKYVALIRLDGLISPDRDFSANNIVPILEDAFSDKAAEGVVIVINSPGGTPVQASIIHDAILAYKKKYHKKVIVVGEDLLTSGAYFVAVAADRIYVNPNTITGSIGVIMKGFGFVELMKKVGVERRVYTAGKDKDRLDPFLPQSADDLKKVDQVMSVVHQNFALAVLEGRKGKLHAAPEVLFTGDFWPGQTALDLGLVDGLGNFMDVSEKEFKTTDYEEYGNNHNFLRMLTGQLNSAFDALFYTHV